MLKGIISCIGRDLNEKGIYVATKTEGMMKLVKRQDLQPIFIYKYFSSFTLFPCFIAFVKFPLTRLTLHEV